MHHRRLRNSPRREKVVGVVNGVVAIPSFQAVFEIIEQIDHHVVTQRAGAGAGHMALSSSKSSREERCSLRMSVPRLPGLPTLISRRTMTLVSMCGSQTYGKPFSRSPSPLRSTMIGRKEFSARGRIDSRTLVACAHPCGAPALRSGVPTRVASWSNRGSFLAGHAIQMKKPAQGGLFHLYGAPGRIRTSDPLVRRPGGALQAFINQ